MAMNVVLACGVSRNKGKYRAQKDCLRRTPNTTSDLLNKAKSISHDDIPHLFHVLSFLYLADPAEKLYFCVQETMKHPMLTYQGLKFVLS